MEVATLLNQKQEDLAEHRNGHKQSTPEELLALQSIHRRIMRESGFIKSARKQMAPADRRMYSAQNFRLGRWPNGGGGFFVGLFLHAKKGIGEKGIPLLTATPVEGDRIDISRIPRGLVQEVEVDGKEHRMIAHSINPAAEPFVHGLLEMAMREHTMSNEIKHEPTDPAV